MKPFNSEMGMDVNDVKKLINSGFKYLIKTCHQWAKDHPFVACVLTFICLLYMFFLSLFSILFYTLPLVIFAAVLLRGSEIKSGGQNRDMKQNKKEDDQTGVSNVTKMTTSTSYCKRRTYLQPQMSRRTLGKDKNFIEDVGTTESQPKEVVSDNEDDFESFIKKYGEIEPDSPTISTAETTTVASMGDSPDKYASNTMYSKWGDSRPDIESRDESEKDEEEQKEETNKVVQWTENDEKNMMDLGNSEIDRNKRLASLIAKRRAKKLLSMQPRRNHIDYLEEFSAFDHQHLDSVGSLMVAKATGNVEQQPVLSAPFSWLPKRNPFDIPYELLEERPVLTGGSFEEDFFARVIEPKEFSSVVDDGGETNPFGEPRKDFLPSFFTKTRTDDELGSSPIRRDSDDDETVKDNEGKTSLQVGDDNTSHQEEFTQEGKEKVSASINDSSPTTNIATETEEKSHPMRLGDSGTKFEMPDVTEEGNNTRSKIETVHNASDPPNVLRTEKEVSDRNSSTSQSEAPKEGNLTSNEQHELKKEDDEHGPDVIEDIHNSEETSALRDTAEAYEQGMEQQKVVDTNKEDGVKSASRLS